MRADLPTGIVTFLFTDIEGSTKLLHELGAEVFAAALAEHRRLIRDACAAKGGVEVDTQGDAFFFAFPTAPGAVAAAADMAEALASGPISVRIGLHTGIPHLTDEGYVGDDVHFAARVAASAHGGQVILSAATAQLVERELTDLGEHRLKDVPHAVPIFQLGDGSFPPLKTISNTNLPRPASSFVGRDDEQLEVLARFEDGARLVTLTGPGGTGKTRLAIEAASELVPNFKAGVFWVGLATLRDPALVTETIAQTLGAKDGLQEHIGEREMLLLLDNLEQVVDCAPDLSELLTTCPNLRLLCTSRELLRVNGEVEYAVPPLAESEAIALFCERSQLEPAETIAELCRRLDDMPLAVELAAARTSVLTPEQILERLSQRLDLLKGGRDAEARQQTLRATIAWSYELLSPEEQQLFARLSIFAGGCTLEAAQEVADADLDTVQSLVEKSLVRFTEGRYWMLETIREYAAEQLAQDDAADIRTRHAAYFLALARQQSRDLLAGEPEEGPVSQLGRELDNLRAAANTGLDRGDVGLVRELIASLYMYWVVRGPYAEGRAWVERALALDDVEDDTRRRLLAALGTLAYAQGDYPPAIAASDEAAFLGARLGGATERIELLRDQAFAALRKGDYGAAEELFRERLVVAIAVDNGVATSSCRLNLAVIANRTESYEHAEELLAENLPFVRSKGQARCEAYTLAGLAETALRRERLEDGSKDALLGAARALEIDDESLVAHCLDIVAASVAGRGEARRAAVILAATEAARVRMGVECDEDETALRSKALAQLDPDSVQAAWAEGLTLDLEEALELARGWD